MRRKSGENIAQELILYAASAALSCLVLFVGLKQLDPNREASKKALEQKKEIAKRLGRPLIQTNSYEVSISFHLLHILAHYEFVYRLFQYSAQNCECLWIFYLELIIAEYLLMSINSLWLDYIVEVVCLGCSISFGIIGLF